MRNLRTLTRCILPGALFLCAFVAPVRAFQNGHGMVIDHRAYREPVLAKPAAGTTYKDPIFGTTIRRITDAVAAGSKGFVCYYPKLNPFNADESKILVYERGGTWHVHALSGERLMTTAVRNGQTDPQPRWHPSDPDLLYWFDANKIYRQNISTRQVEMIQEFPDYQFITNYDEGNYNANGRIVALAGRHWPWATGLQHFFVFDIDSRQRLTPIMEATGKPLDWISISPTGQYMVVHIGQPHGGGQWQGIDVYKMPELTLMLLPYYPYSDHADLGLDAQGEDVYVTDNAEDTFPDRLRHLESYRLRDGQKTDLLGLHWGLSRLVSTRNLRLPGWAVISTYSSPEHLADTTVAPFDDEIFAVKLDGSYEVRRIAQHRSQRFSVGNYSYNNYWDQPNAAISWSGRYILFSSNWRELEAPQDVYLIDLSKQAGWIVAGGPADAIPPGRPENVLVRQY